MNMRSLPTYRRPFEASANLTTLTGQSENTPTRLGKSQFARQAVHNKPAAIIKLRKSALDLYKRCGLKH
jgi:hypothetical protein